MNIQRRRNTIATVVIVLLVLIVGAVTVRWIWIQHLLRDPDWVESITYQADEPLEITGETYGRIEFGDSAGN